MRTAAKISGFTCVANFCRLSATIAWDINSEQICHDKPWFVKLTSPALAHIRGTPRFLGRLLRPPGTSGLSARMVTSSHVSCIYHGEYAVKGLVAPGRTRSVRPPRVRRALGGTVDVGLPVATGRAGCPGAGRDTSFGGPVPALRISADSDFPSTGRPCDEPRSRAHRLWRHAGLQVRSGPLISCTTGCMAAGRFAR